MYRFHYWRVRIEDAHDERTIAQILQDYRRTIPPAIAGSLPPECREAIDGDDIPSAAMTLLHAEMKRQAPPPVTGFLHEAAQTYAAAAVKLAAWRSGR